MIATPDWSIKSNTCSRETHNAGSYARRRDPTERWEITCLNQLGAQGRADGAADHHKRGRCAGKAARGIHLTQQGLFDYDPSRGGAVPLRLLDGFTGILQTDGYEAYCAVAEAKGLVHAGCYAHARRRSEDARKSQADPSRDGQSKIALDLIGRLYRIERGIKTASLTERLSVQRAQSVPVVGEFKAWLDTMAERVLPQSALGKAVFYSLSQWRKLTKFLDQASKGRGVTRLIDSEDFRAAANVAFR